MAGAELGRHAQAGAHRRGVVHILAADHEAIGLQMRHPLLAAAAIRRFVDGNVQGGLRQRHAGQKTEQKQGDQGQAAFHGGSRAGFGLV